MRKNELRSGLDIATALGIWADARERAATELWRKAAGLERAGRIIEAAHMRAAARHHSQKLLQERARAGAFRSRAPRLAPGQDEGSRSSAGGKRRAAA